MILTVLYSKKGINNVIFLKKHKKIDTIKHKVNKQTNGVITLIILADISKSQKREEKIKVNANNIVSIFPAKREKETILKSS